MAERLPGREFVSKGILLAMDASSEDYTPYGAA